MAPKRRGFDGDFTITGSGPKRAKVGSVDVGADVFVLHSVPRTKRAFAGMHGVVCSTKGCCTAEVSFKIPRTICALYSDFLGVDGSCIVKFPCSQLDSHPEKASTRKIPFQLTAVQRQLGALLGPKALVSLYATARGIVAGRTLSACLAASLRRTCRQLGDVARFERAKKQWAGWCAGICLKRHCYGEVRDALLSCVTNSLSGISTTAIAFLPHIGVRFDSTILETMLRLKSALVMNKFCDLSCNAAIRHFIGGRVGHAIKNGYTAKVLMQAFLKFPDVTSWMWQDRVLQALARPVSAELNADALHRTCYAPTVNFCLLCINDIAHYPEQLQTASGIINVLGSLGCDDHAVYRKLIRHMSSVQDALVELQCHRWREEPLTLGRDLAAAFDVVIWVFDIRTFLAGACLIRLVPVESLWPVAQALLSDFNKKQMVAACGYPGKPTHFFTHVIHAFIQRDPLHFEPYIRLRFMVCGPKEEAWLQRCLSDAKKPTQAVSKVPKAAAYTAPTTRGKRRRECGSV